MRYRNHVNHLFIIFIFFISGSVLSEELIQAKKWSYVEGENFKNIHTSNLHNLEFGYTCKDFCTFYISPSLICSQDKAIDGWMIQTDGVGTRIQTICISNKNVTLLAINSEKNLIDLLKNSKQVHFLINFDVKTNSLMTFDLDGFGELIDKIQR